ncbi:MAG: helix-turn-helix domain-containing protein [Candidatus Humimicrobiaceae bacterium]
MKGISWEDGKKILFQNPEFSAEHERTEPELQALKQLILLRKQKKISQQILAARINMRQSHIARLESGEVRPTIRILKRYAKGLGQILLLNIIPEKEFVKNYS